MARRVLVSLTAHERPDLVAFGCRNYDWAFGGRAVQVVHIARKRREAFLAGFRPPASVIVNPVVAETFHENNFGGHVANLRHAVAEGVPFDTVYMRTANDLIVRPGLPAAMEAAEVGFGRASLLKPDNKDFWRDAIAADANLHAFLRRLGVEGGVPKAHTDGGFFPRDVLEEVLDLMFGGHGESALSPAAIRYPPQEFWMPAAVDHVVGRRGLRRARNAILALERTRPRGAPGATPEDVAAVAEGRAEDLVRTYWPDGVFGLKYFTPDPDDAGRRAVAAMMGEA